MAERLERLESVFTEGVVVQSLPPPTTSRTTLSGAAWTAKKQQEIGTSG